MARDTMEPIAFIRKQLEEVEPDVLRALLHEVVDQVMSAEVDTLTGAGHGERTPERVNRGHSTADRTVICRPMPWHSRSARAAGSSRPPRSSPPA